MAPRDPEARPRPTPPPIYAIADAEALEPGTVADGVRAMTDAGVGWVQVRAKRLVDRELWRQLEASCRAVEGTATRLWIDDRADLAALFPVAGLHLGQADLPPAAAREVVGDRCWIGRSTHNEAQAAAADGDPEVDLVALGPVFPTTGKRNPDPVVGLELVRRVARRCEKPLVAIGGIDAASAAPVLAAGARSVALLGAVCRGDVAANCRRLAAAVDGRVPGYDGPVTEGDGR